MHHDESNTHASLHSRRVPWKLIVVATLIGIAITVSRSFDVTHRVTDAMDWIESRGTGGAAAFVGLYVLATVFAFPASLLTLGAGAIYGVPIGFLLVSLGSTAGATAAFLIARYVARGWVAQRIEGNPKFRALDEGVAEEGWKIVLLTRLVPLFPFNLQNYGYGLTRIPAPHYVAASWLGMIPGTFVYVYIGHAAGSIAEALSGGESLSVAEWGLFAAGLVAAIAVAVVITRVARRKLAEVQQTS